MSIPPIDGRLQNLSINFFSSFDTEEVSKLIEDFEWEPLPLEVVTKKTHLWMKELDILFEQYRQGVAFAREKLNYLCILNNKIGIDYQLLGKYHIAIEYHEKALQIAQEIKIQYELGKIYFSLQEIQDQHELGKIYFNLGNAYRFLGEYCRAIEYHEQALQIAKQFENQSETGKIYCSLGNIYHSLGNYPQAIVHHEQALQIAQKTRDLDGQAASFGNLGNMYKYIGKYRKAIECHEKCLQIAKKIQDHYIVGQTYSHIGNLYRSLGEYRRAIEYHEQALQIAQEIGNRESQGAFYGNLGIAYASLKEDNRAIEFHGQSLKIAQEIGNRNGEGASYNNLGHSYYSIGDYSKAIDCHEKRLYIALDVKDRAGEGLAYGNLGIACQALTRYDEAIKYYEKALNIAYEIEAQFEKGEAYHNLGSVYKALNNASRAEDYFRKSITTLSKLQNDLRDNFQNQITIFEQQAKVYLELEQLFIEQNEIDQALAITEVRRARALVASINSSSKLKKISSMSSSSLTHIQMQKLAYTLQTTFIIYSLSTHIEINKDKKYSTRAWIISSQGEITSYQLPWDEKHSFEGISNQLQSLVKEVENLSSIKRGGPDELDFDLDDLDLEAELALLNSDPEVEKLAATKQAEKIEKDQNALKKLKQEKLRPWYDLLIAPLESALPAHGSSITIIPDGVLSQFPFGAFCDKQGTYLIEKYAISLAPSIKTLQLLHQLPNEFPDTSLVVGSPDTGHSLDYLEVADREAKTVSNLINGSQLLNQKQATITHVSQKMQEARFIHLACHGLAEKKYDKHSVFEGLFKLAPDESDSKGELYAQQIAALNLKAELVFLSACYSGKGNVKQEGSIGPVWSFLGAGAKSTVATYWPLPDSATTFEMVESFYQGILNTDRASLNKAQVLRQVTLKAMAKNRDDFIQWGAFFLSGVSIDAKVD